MKILEQYMNESTVVVLDKHIPLFHHGEQTASIREYLLRSEKIIGIFQINDPIPDLQQYGINTCMGLRFRIYPTVTPMID